MTGKELVLAFVGAGLVGGGAGVAASVAMAPKAEAPAAPSAELLDRLEVLEGQLAQAKKSAEESRRTFDLGLEQPVMVRLVQMADDDHVLSVV